jgi:hypothetical protein
MDGSPASIVTREAHKESNDFVVNVATTPTIDPFLPNDTLSNNTSHNLGRVDVRKELNGIVESRLSAAINLPISAVTCQRLLLVCLPGEKIVLELRLRIDVGWHQGYAVA